MEEVKPAESEPAEEELEEITEPEPAKPDIEAREVHEAPEEPVVEMPVLDLKEQIAYVEANESDYQARIELARALWRTGDVEEAVEHYVRLIRANELLDKVIEDLESYAERDPKDPRSLQTLGDAYMKEGELDKALAAYKRAMNLF
jgi:tetratricopeptide (TPR) repeat protein